MIENRRNILFVFIVIVAMVTGYGLNSQLQEVPYMVELPTENQNTLSDFQSDFDSPENGNSNHVPKIICIIDNGPASFAIKNPALLNFHAFAVWQPPKNY